MSDQGPEQAPEAPMSSALPRVENLPVAPHGYDPEGVRDAFDAFRRHSAQLQALLRILLTARSAQLEPTGHAVRVDALHLIRAAAEFADTLERDAQTACAAQVRRAEEEIRRRYREMQDRESAFEGFREESERRRAEIVSAAKNEALELVARAKADAARDLREAEAGGTRLLEEARQQAAELTNSARAEVEQTLEWARGQAAAIVSRAQRGAEQLLASAGLGEEAVAEVAEAIVRAAEQTNRTPRPATLGPPASEPPRIETKPPEPAPRGETPSAMAWGERKP